MLIIPTTTALGQALALVLNGLCALVAHHAPRSPLGALLTRAHGRLFRLALRIDSLARHWQQGTLPKRRIRARRTRTPIPTPPAAVRIGPPPVIGLPTPHAWLVRLLQPTAQFAGQVEVFLDQPDTRALYEAAPQAGRLLRPLCRALAITPPPWLRLPPRPRARPTPRPKPPARPESPRQGTPDRPLAANIRAAVRAWGKNTP